MPRVTCVEHAAHQLLHENLLSLFIEQQILVQSLPLLLFVVVMGIRVSSIHLLDDVLESDSTKIAVVLGDLGTVNVLKEQLSSVSIQFHRLEGVSRLVSEGFVGGLRIGYHLV